MTLIECLFEYSRLIELYGYTEARAQMTDIVGEKMMKHIEMSVTKSGRFVRGDASEFTFTKEIYLP
jgi:hypothetical protein